MSTRRVTLLLALSPLALVICFAGFGYFNKPILGLCFGALAIFIPLSLLVFRDDDLFSAHCRRMLRLAALAVLLLPMGLGLRLEPKYSTASNDAGEIRLDPPPHTMPVEGAAFLRGLSVKDGVMIVKARPQEAADNPSPFSACDYMDWFYPPSHFADENGNGLDFKLTGENLLHLQDDRGGYADVKWDGTKFLLIASHSAGQAANAKSPSGGSVLAGKFGTVLLLLAPLLAWVMVTLGLQFNRAERNGPSSSLLLGTILQIAGIIVLSTAILGAPASPDEVSGGLLVLFVLAAAACCIVGVATCSWHLLRLQNSL